ncbi:MAG: DNA primase [Paludibacteraceae bacterium]|nr:DNA primase [Paludibacteraceae bacterium]MBN2787864.1 DNA primase [Paludibacteraceae bacterium]
MIDLATIDRIIEAAQIEQVVSDYVTLRKRGVNLIGLCPFHNEKTPSFTVSPAKGICKCFGCGKGGNAVNFIMEIEQLNYYEALKHLAKKYNIEVVEKEMTAEQLATQNDRESMLVVNAYAQKYFSTLLHEHIDGKSIGLSYFKERGFSEAIIKKFQLGYSLDQRDAFTQEAIKQGYKKEYLVKTGLTLESETGNSLADRFRGRVLFPVHSISGKIVAFGGRILKKDDKMAKYLNSPESEVYHKSNELYGIFFAKQAIVKNDRCFLVEGYTDVISMHQSGIENVVASSGTSLTQGQIKLIHRFTPNITVIYDGDAAGIKASIRGIDMLLEEGMNVKVVLLPEGEDPDSFAKKQNASDFIAYIEQNSLDFISFKAKLLLEDAGNDPIKRAHLITDIVRSISVIPDNIIRSVYIKECSILMSINENVLYNEINKLKRDAREKELGLAYKEKKHFPQENIPINTTQTVENNFDQQELNLLRYVVRYGELNLFPKKTEATTENNPTVIAYICNELEADELSLYNPLHALLLENAKNQLHHPDFKAENHFLKHPNPAISQLALNLATDKYTLSATQAKQLDKETDHLHHLVPKAVYEFKNKIILHRISEKMQEMKIANDEKNATRMDELMHELNALNEVKKALSKELGERIIIKF